MSLSAEKKKKGREGDGPSNDPEKPHSLRNGVHSLDRITISPTLLGQSRGNTNLPIHKLGGGG